MQGGGCFRELCPAPGLPVEMATIDPGHITKVDLIW
jgi:hypothetical protein